MPNTYTLITSLTTSGSSNQSFVLNNIPSSYNDLSIVISPRNDFPTGVRMNINMSVNGLNTSIYNNIVVGGNGISGPGSGTNYTGTNQWYIGEIQSISNTAGYYANFEIYVPNYSSSTLKKSATWTGTYESNTTEGHSVVGGGTINLTAAITRVDIYSGAGSFVDNSTIYLYGIKNT